MNAPDFTTTRRTVLGGIGALAIAGSGLAMFSDRASAQMTGLTIEGDAITTDDGTLSDVLLSVRGNWRYDGVDPRSGHTIKGVKVVVEAGRPDSPGHPYAIGSQWIPVEPDMKAGSGTFEIADKSIFVGGHYGPVVEDFFAPDDGSSKSTSVLVHVHMSVKFNGPAGPTGASAYEQTTFVVTVTNQEATAFVAGEGEAEAVGENQYPLGEGDPALLGLTWSTGECMFRVDNNNPVGTAPIPYRLAEYGNTSNYVEGVAEAGHFGPDGKAGQVAPGNYHDIIAANSGTAILRVDGTQVDTKAAGNCSQV
ncbi:hypothetical protein ACFQH6_18360 [Halobacteriaceae archaeon GCM10025711]